MTWLITMNPYSMGANGPAVISSCLMSIPISIVISKLRVPETEEPLTTPHDSIINMNPDDNNTESGVLHALANGAWLGLKVAGMVLANILVIISLIALANGILHWTFKYIQAPNVTIEQICGYIFYPVAFLLGVPRNELYLVGQLLGIKVIQNEFVAFGTLTASPEYAHLSQRADLISTYAICGFANIGSIAILLGIYGQFSPKRRGDFAKEAVSACICGALATFMSASLAGMLFSL
jgi:CNT family concentrative nucleoside transporter